MRLFKYQTSIGFSYGYAIADTVGEAEEKIMSAVLPGLKRTGLVDDVELAKVRITHLEEVASEHQTALSQKLIL